MLCLVETANIAEVVTDPSLPPYHFDPITGVRNGGGGLYRSAMLQGSRVPVSEKAITYLDSGNVCLGFDTLEQAISELPTRGRHVRLVAGRREKVGFVGTAKTEGKAIICMYVCRDLTTKKWSCDPGAGSVQAWPFVEKTADGDLKIVMEFDTIDDLLAMARQRWPEYANDEEQIAMAGETPWMGAQGVIHDPDDAGGRRFDIYGRSPSKRK